MSELQHKIQDLRIERAEPARRRGRRFAIAALVVMALAAAAWWLARPGAVRVRTAVARETEAGAAGTVLNASGYVTARRRATVSSKFTGKVAEVLIEEGMAVEADQLLARLDDTNAAVAVRLSAAELQAARADLEETRVRLAQAGRDLQRIEGLVRGEVASASDLERAKAEVDALAARLGSQEEAVRVADRRAAVDRQMLADSEIRAPFAGVVVSKDAQPGEMVSPVSGGGGFTRTGIGTIVDMASLEIEVDVNEAYINRIRSEQAVTARLDAYPDWDIPARVIAIVPTADRQKATVKVRIGFERLDPRILPDMGVKVAFRTAEPALAPAVAVLLPSAAIRRVEGRDVVFVVAGEGVERRAVTLGEERDGEVVVRSGIAAGERVVIEGPAELGDGDRVREES